MELTEFTTLRQQARTATHDARTARCLPHGGAHFQLKAWQVAAWNRDNYVAMWRARAAKVRTWASRCELAKAWAWYWTSATQCVVNKEGGWASVSPSGTYRGRFQADTSFARTYGPTWALERWGPYANRWPQPAQVLMGYRGWRARYYYPWPTTARECGLI